MPRIMGWVLTATETTHRNGADWASNLRIARRRSRVPWFRHAGVTGGGVVAPRFVQGVGEGRQLSASPPVLVTPTFALLCVVNAAGRRHSS